LHLQLERRVHEHAGAKESAWAKAGLKAGIQIWRIEKFAIIDCSDWVAHEKKCGTFYDGDSYIVLHVSGDHRNWDDTA
jgi:gelsolin